MRILFTLFAICTVLSTYAQKNTSGLSVSPAQPAQEAKTFGLNVIQLYYNGNCNTVFNYLGTEITHFESGTKFQKAEISAADFCATNPFHSTLQQNNYNIYLANYSPEVLDHTQFSAKFPGFWIQLQPGDFYFDGTVKTGTIDVFKAADMARFILRKNAAGQFEIISM